MPKGSMLVAQLDVNDMKHGIQRLEREISELEDFNPNDIEDLEDDSASIYASSIRDTLAKIFEPDTADYHRHIQASYLDVLPFPITEDTTRNDVVRAYERNKKSSLKMLRSLIDDFKYEISLNSARGIDNTTKNENNRINNKKIFIVHGHGEVPKLTVARFLEAIDFIPIILNEQNNRGSTVVEKLERHSDVGFAVVLLTPDDVGKHKDEKMLAPRARQNVVLELGYFAAKLGRQNVMVLMKDNVEIPSDYVGVATVTFDTHGAWKTKLGNELSECGYDVDFGKVARA